MSNLTILLSKLKGGAGSGNFGHAGVPGHLGGSASGGSVGDAKSAIMRYANKMGIGKSIKFNEKKDGTIEIMEGSKKSALHITKDGKIISKHKKELIVSEDGTPTWKKL